MGKLWALLDVLRKGNAVADPALWKNRGAATVALTALLLALSRAARGLGYELVLTDADAASLAAGIVTVVSLWVTFATSRKIGVPGLDPSQVPAKPGPDFPAIGPAEPAQPGVDWKSVSERDFRPDPPGYNAERGS